MRGTRPSASSRPAGHEIERCHEAGSSAFACRAVGDDSRCPLDDAPVDVVVAARGADGGPTTEDEAGVRCAVQRRVPVVLVGNRAGASFAGWEATTSDGGPAELLDRVEWAARAGF